MRVVPMRTRNVPRALEDWLRSEHRAKRWLPGDIKTIGGKRTFVAICGVSGLERSSSCSPQSLTAVVQVVTWPQDRQSFWTAVIKYCNTAVQTATAAGLGFLNGDAYVTEFKHERSVFLMHSRTLITQGYKKMLNHFLYHLSYTEWAAYTWSKRHMAGNIPGFSSY